MAGIIQQVNLKKVSKKIDKSYNKLRKNDKVKCESYGESIRYTV